MGQTDGPWNEAEISCGVGSVPSVDVTSRCGDVTSSVAVDTSISKMTMIILILIFTTQTI